MATEEDTSNRGKYVAWGLKIMVAIILFPLIPLAVMFNVLGTADRLAFLPGIANGGGAMAAVVTIVYIGAVVGIVAGGGAVATGGSLSTVNGDDPTGVKSTPTTTSTPTSTPMATFTPTPSPTPTTTTSSSEVRRQSLDAFKSNYRTRVSRTMSNDTLTGVPILAMGYNENSDGRLELWVVFWECDYSESETNQWLTLGNEFVGSVGELDGAQPDRLRIYGVTNLTNFEDEITYIQTSSAEAGWNGSMSQDTYTENWWERKHKPIQSENDTAYQLVANDSGPDIANNAFYNDHADDDKFSCNGGAEPGIGSDDRENSQNAATLSPAGIVNEAAAVHDPEARYTPPIDPSPVMFFNIVTR